MLALGRWWMVRGTALEIVGMRCTGRCAVSLAMLRLFRYFPAPMVSCVRDCATTAGNLTSHEPG
jgi:hypothetical protein